MAVVPDVEPLPATAEGAEPPMLPEVAAFIARMKARTPEEIMAAREAAFAASRPPRPLPPGKSLEDVVCGHWPGDETDEEIRDLLRKIS